LNDVFLRSNIFIRLLRIFKLGIWYWTHAMKFNNFGDAMVCFQEIIICVPLKYSVVLLQFSK